MKKHNFSTPLFLLFAIISLNFASCTDLSDIENDVNQLKTDVENLKSTVEALQAAYDKGMLISSVSPHSVDGKDGWLVTFSDLSTIQIFNGTDGKNGEDGKDGENGKDGSTPFLSTDENGFWTVSYDENKTFTQITDKNQKPVSATGDKGDEGISVRVAITDDNFYKYELYYASNPSVVIEAIVTPYTANKSQILQSIVKDENSQVITLTTMDKKTFSFNLDVAYPTGIIMLSAKTESTPYAITTFEFRVNPSNATFNYDVTSSSCQVELDLASKTRASYVTKPENYKLIRIKPSVDESGKIKTGQYTAYIEDLGKSISYEENITLVINTKDGKGEKIQISSDVMPIHLEQTLPVVYINTNDNAPIVDKDNWIPGTMDIKGLDESDNYNGTMNIKGRGNSTWGYPKKPYAIKLDSKSKILGFPKHKRWVLLANWMDKTLLRNHVAFEISKNTGLAWTPRGKFVELVLNGEPQGNYYLCEQIKIDENRLNINELSNSDTDAESITGGYLLELDVYYDEVNKFHSKLKELPFMIKEPDEEELNTAQF